MLHFVFCSSSFGRFVLHFAPLTLAGFPRLNRPWSRVIVTSSWPVAMRVCETLSLMRECDGHTGYRRQVAAVAVFDSLGKRFGEEPGSSALGTGGWGGADNVNA